MIQIEEIEKNLKLKLVGDQVLQFIYMPVVPGTFLIYFVILAAPKMVLL